MREKTVEEYLGEQTAKLGCPCIKFHPDTKAGMPDRLILLPDSQVLWIELKTKGGELSKLQKYQHHQLSKLGHRVFTLWNKADVDKLIETLHTELKITHEK